MPEKKLPDKHERPNLRSTQAGEYVREEIEHVREGKHGARSAKQVIAIGLSKARRAGVKLPPPPGKKAPKATGRRPNPTRSRAAHQKLEREGTAAAAHTALSRQAHSSANRRGSANRRAAAQKAVRTKGAAGRHDCCAEAVRTRGGPWGTVPRRSDLCAGVRLPGTDC
jgi:Family of unknown function (DUF6496)